MMAATTEAESMVAVEAVAKRKQRRKSSFPNTGW